MKKILFATMVTVFAVASLQSNAQIKKGAYGSLSVGYNAAAGASNVSGDLALNNRTTTSTGTSSTSTTESVKYSFGTGINAGLQFGYMINDNIGVELGVSYLLGGKTTAVETSTGGFGSGTQTTDVSAKMLQINPSVVFATSINKMSPYAKLGLVIGSGTITQNENSVSGVNNSVAKAEYKGGIALGFSSALGVNFAINDKLSLNTELSLINMQYSPTKASLTVATSNGVDQLPSYTVRDREVEFSKSITTGSGTTSSNTVPRQATSFATPFGSIGINVGIRYSF
jgi:outer membrane protein W